MHDSHPARISIVLVNMGEVNQAALKYLLLHLNTLQSAFEFEMLPLDRNEPLARLISCQSRINRSHLRDELRDFFNRTRLYLADLNDGYDISSGELPEKIILLTMSRFDDKYYSVRSGPVNVLALGDWERHMAPPSLLEFILTLVLRQAVAFSSPLLSGSVHLGTKGCLMDFTASLDDVRLKSLQGFICHSCRKKLSEDGLAYLADELVDVLDMSKWLGKTDDPSSPAGIVASFGYDLFTTKGVKPSIVERVNSALREEGLKEIIRLTGGISLAALLLWLGLKK